MMSSDDIIKIIAALGVGSGASAVATAIIAARSGKGKSRAEAADLLISAAERVGRLNAEQDKEIQELKGKLNAAQMVIFRFLAEEISEDEMREILKGLR